MRNAFAKTINELAGANPEVVMLSGDIGNRLFDEYRKNHPGRFYNCGVAEANMIGVAAGLALCGFRPVAYTITPFITARVIEQIKVDICYYNLPVVIVSVGGGLSYAELGVTHLACDDIALLRLYPNMSVVCPADTAEVRLALEAALRHDGPVYIRLGKKNEPAAHTSTPEFAIGKAITLREGADVCILAVGNLVPTALDAAEDLEKAGVSTRVVSNHTVKPLDTALLEEVFARYRVVVSVEEHFMCSGFGSALAEWLVDRPPVRARLLRIGIRDEFFAEAGKQKDARERFGLTHEAIAERTLRLLSETR